MPSLISIRSANPTSLLSESKNLTDVGRGGRPRQATRVRRLRATTIERSFMVLIRSGEYEVPGEGNLLSSSIYTSLERNMPGSGVEIRGTMQPGFEQILTAGARDFLAMLHREFNPRRLELLDRRRARQRRIGDGDV